MKIKLPLILSAIFCSLFIVSTSTESAFYKTEVPTLYKQDNDVLSDEIAVGESLLPQTGVPYYGELRIPDVNIRVALYDDFSQATCDKSNGAAMSRDWGMIIADHSNQAFYTLKNVRVGMTGSITLKNGAKYKIKCTKLIDGHNTSNDITDGSYKSVWGKYPIMTYTCLNGWQNIRICCWTITDWDASVPKTDKMFYSYFIYNLKKVQISSVSNAKSGVKVKWASDTGKYFKGHIEGYQVKYSTDKTFKTGSGKTFVSGYKSYYTVLKNLKPGKKYYIKMRTRIKSPDGVTYYSGWSSTQSIKTSK